jgi:hypothetical protein
MGEITLPDGDGTFAAILVFVTSLPAALGMTAPVSTMGDTPAVNSFVVSGGVNDNAASELFGFVNLSTPL